MGQYSLTWTSVRFSACRTTQVIWLSGNAILLGQEGTLIWWLWL